MVVYENLQCGDCAALRHMLDRQILPQYGASVAFEFYDFPSVKHVWSRLVSAAALYVEAHDTLLAPGFRRFALDNIERIRQSGFEVVLKQWCGYYNLNPMQMIAGLADKQLALNVESSHQQGVARGVKKTPTVFIGDEVLIETFTAEELSQAIERALNH